MRIDGKRAAQIVLTGVVALMGCGTRGGSGDEETSLAALMDDGALTMGAPAAAAPPAPPPPPRYCGDCAREPLAFWMFEDCGSSASTQLADSANGFPISHPAFRAVSVACVPSNDGQGVKLAGADDIVYAPDQADFTFNQGLTVAAWINPDSVSGTQSLVRKRFDGTSSFILAIDGRKLVFGLRLTNGKIVAVTAPIAAKRFTHVAATYDGQQASLYVDGNLAGSAKAAGTIAPGVGPILIGNDASGRLFKGTIDDVWLNTLAAPLDEIKTLTCIRKPPVVSLSPGQTAPTPPGTPVPFDLSVTNPSPAVCPADSFQFYASSLPFPLTTDTYFGTITAGPGQTAHATINISAFEAGASGPVPFQYTVFGPGGPSSTATAQATFVVATPPPPMRTGCASAPGPVAPGGYYVNGNTICTPDGRAHLLHGVARMSLEWNPAGENLSRGDFALMGSWNANVVRMGLNQDFWLAGSPLYDASYANTVDNAIAWAEMAGMDVILDLHWSDRGTLGSCPPSAGCQQLMADANSVTFWSEVAARYKNDGRVMFELYNEPHDIPWQVWKSGGDTGQGWQAVGMQQLYDTVRATGAQNLVLIGGLNWGYDLSGVPANRIGGYNIVYTTHPYGTPDGFTRPPSEWNRTWGFLTQTDPVVATEFGVLNDNSCGTQYQQQVIAYADAHFAGWTAWVWFAGDCSTGFITLIRDWAGTPSPEGTIVRAALLGYNDPPASPPRPRSGPDFGYTFDGGTQGWHLNNYDDPNLQNLAVHPPAGGTVPSLIFDPADGNPNPGALQLRVGFTAFDQYVDNAVFLSQPGQNLAGKTLHARVKLVSGSLPNGGVQLYTLTGPNYTWGATFVSGSAFPPGTWVPIDLDLSTITASGYDPSKVVQIGVQVVSGFSGGGGTFMNTGDTVFEIDTVTD